MRLLILLLLFKLSALAQSPNILFVLADDLGIDALNGYELATVRPNTPHLDSLRKSGLNFVNAWSAPVCTPTRAMIMSGKYGSKTGVTTAPGHLDTSHASIFRALRAANPTYATAAIGKWHISQPADPRHPGYHGAQHYMGILGATWPAYDNWPRTENGATATATSYVTAAFTDDALRWIGEQRTPWMLWLAHVAPHTPIHVPPAGTYSQTATTSRLQRYLAMIESLDFEVGRLLRGMTAAQRANTVIILAGDNGTPNPTLQGFPAGHGKQTLYDGAIRVPLFVSGFGVSRKGQTDSALVNLLDIYATVLEIGGQPLEGGIYNSRSFKGSLSAKPTAVRQYNFAELTANGSDIDVDGYAIRDLRHKLIVYKNGTEELFDLEADPLETKNLLVGTLTATQTSARLDLLAEAKVTREGWSCRDGIRNGAETGVDCGGTCAACIPSSVSERTADTGLRVYPMPSRSTVTLISTAGPIERYTVMDAVGRLVMSAALDVEQESVVLSVDGWPAGTYTVGVRRFGRTGTVRIVVE